MGHTDQSKAKEILQKLKTRLAMLNCALKRGKIVRSIYIIQTIKSLAERLKSSLMKTAYALKHGQQ